MPLLVCLFWFLNIGVRLKSLYSTLHHEKWEIFIGNAVDSQEALKNRYGTSPLPKECMYHMLMVSELIFS